MSFNPFTERVKSADKHFEDLRKICLTPNGDEISVHTKCRLLFALSIEFEAISFSHFFHIRSEDNDIRRAISVLRRVEQQQQKKLQSLVSFRQTHLESSVLLEYLATELTAMYAQNESDNYTKRALDFTLLEDYDHLYSFANLLELESGVLAEDILEKSIDIQSGRRCTRQHRHPFDDIKRRIPLNSSTLLTKLNTLLISSVERYSMYYYGVVQSLSDSKLARNLFAEVGILEEQHITQYSSLLDSGMTLLESLLLHEYMECYLYYCLYKDESDKRMRGIYERNFEYELSHLRVASELLNRYEGKDYSVVVGEGKFPFIFSFERNIGRNSEYIKSILKQTNDTTGFLEDYAKAGEIPSSYQYFRYNEAMRAYSPSDTIIESRVNEFGTDYTFTNDDD